MSFTLQFVFAASTAMLVNVVVIPFLIKLSMKHNWYDEVDERKIHSGKIPRIGGVGIVLSFLVVTILYFLISGLLDSPLSLSFKTLLLKYRFFFLGMIVIHLVGLLDDFTNLRPLYKLIAQVITAVFIILTGYYFKSFYIPFIGITITSIPLGGLITLIWIVGVTNAVNLIDGMDGLSSGTTAIAAFFMGLGALASGNGNQAMLIFILFGSIAGFLIYNFPPAKLFMGDSGSLFLGFTLAVLPLFSLKGAITPYSLVLSVSFLFIPILDTTAAVIRRKIKGVPFHSPDKEHLHHKLLALGVPTTGVLAIVYGATFILSVVSYLFILTLNTTFIIALVCLWALYIILFVLLAKKQRETHTKL